MSGEQKKDAPLTNLERLRYLEKRVLRLEYDAKLLRPLAEWATKELIRYAEEDLARAKDGVRSAE